MFDILLRYPVLANVIKAVWGPKKAIFFTFFLYLVIMYVFTVFSYFYLYKVYADGFCDSLWRCLLTSFDKSFKNDGGIGGFLNPYDDLTLDGENGTIDGRDKNIYMFVYFFYRNLFFIILLIVMLNIVSGIIIDEFKSLRL